ncbi:hypothetical protein HELRODRAFT_175918 [Helobdella robusta]|uniref:Ubiquitin-like protease family profile domain-containing protein n=1 Tax=Helobdella robusta TaxID=6412 RepID=T1F9W0_HELRO|nr:hypothetical protein HELRODRAFT_175918 [Helobdella robusta]ESO00478.1 hypothetical protein HELRODRAFT_175918 [Helobdella robusta]
MLSCEAFFKFLLSNNLKIDDVENNYRSKHSIYGQACLFFKKENTLNRRRNFYDFWRKNIGTLLELNKSSKNSFIDACVNQQDVEIEAACCQIIIPDKATEPSTTVTVTERRSVVNDFPAMTSDSVSVAVVGKTFGDKYYINSQCTGICFFDRGEDNKLLFNVTDEVKYQWINNVVINYEYDEQEVEDVRNSIKELMKTEEVQQTLILFDPNVFPFARSERSGYEYYIFDYVNFYIKVSDWDFLINSTNVYRNHFLLNLLIPVCNPCVLNFKKITVRPKQIVAYIYCSFNHCRLFKMQIKSPSPSDSLVNCKILTNIKYYFHVGKGIRQLRGLERNHQKRKLANKLPTLVRMDCINASDDNTVHQGNMMQIHSNDVLAKARSESLSVDDEDKDDVFDVILKLRNELLASDSDRFIQHVSEPLCIVSYSYKQVEVAKRNKKKDVLPVLYFDSTGSVIRRTSSKQKRIFYYSGVITVDLEKKRVTSICKEIALKLPKLTKRKQLKVQNIFEEKWGKRKPKKRSFFNGCLLPSKIKQIMSNDVVPNISEVKVVENMLLNSKDNVIRQLTLNKTVTTFPNKLVSDPQFYMHNLGDNGTAMAKIGDLIYFEDFRTLNGKEWLSTTIVDILLEKTYIMKKSIYVPSGLSTAALNKGFNDKCSILSMLLFSKKYTFIPYLLNGNHYCCFVADAEKGTVFFYNPIITGNICEEKLQSLFFSFLKCYCSFVNCNANWIFTPQPKSCEQRDTWNCGIYLIRMLRMLDSCQQLTETFDPDDLRYTYQQEVLQSSEDMTNLCLYCGNTYNDNDTAESDNHNNNNSNNTNTYNNNSTTESDNNITNEMTNNQDAKEKNNNDNQNNYNENIRQTGNKNNNNKFIFVRPYNRQLNSFYEEIITTLILHGCIQNHNDILQAYTINKPLHRILFKH